jgi:hypothetical protein
MYTSNGSALVHEFNEGATVSENFESRFDDINNEQENEPNNLSDFVVKGQDNQVIEPDQTNHRGYSINVPRTGASHKKCVICNRLNEYQSLTLISDEAVFHAYVHTCRACPGHFNKIKLFKESVLQKMISYKDTTELSRVSLESFFQAFREFGKSQSLFSKFKDASTITEKSVSVILDSQEMNI